MKNAVIIGIRTGYYNLTQVIPDDEDNINYLSSKYDAFLRSAAIKLGVKGTLKGHSINFFVVSSYYYEMITAKGFEVISALTHNVVINPLISITDAELIQTTNEVNEQYPVRMEKEEYKQYKKDLILSISKKMKKLNHEITTPKKTVTVPKGLEVGSFFTIDNWISNNRTTIDAILCKVVKINSNNFIYEKYKVVDGVYPDDDVFQVPLYDDWGDTDGSDPLDKFEMFGTSSMTFNRYHLKDCLYTESVYATCGRKSLEKDYQ